MARSPRPLLRGAEGSEQGYRGYRSFLGTSSFRLNVLQVVQAYRGDPLGFFAELLFPSLMVTAL